MVTGLFIEVNYAEHIAMVGNGNCRHREFSGLFKKLLQTDHAVKQAVLSVNMKMDKIGVLHNTLIEPIIRRFFCNNDVMNMAFPEAGGSDANKS